MGCRPRCWDWKQGKKWREMGHFLVEVRILGFWGLPEVSTGLGLAVEGKTLGGRNLSGALGFLNWLWKV